MQILNIASYKFIALQALPELRARLLTACEQAALKGTILLSHEGINLNLAGTAADIAAFKAVLLADARFQDMIFKESYSTAQPFNRMKVKIKKEIITMRRPEVDPASQSAPTISPREFKRWLDENKEMTVLDTRNDYEVEFVTFQNAVNLHFDDDINIIWHLAASFDLF